MRVRARVSIATGLIAGAGCLSGIPQAAADDLACYSETDCYFLSPTGNSSCEIHVEDGPASAYCQSVSSTQSVMMDASGNITPCTGDQCLGNPAPGIPTLAYGQAARLGPFACLSTTDDMTCTVDSDMGFAISRDGVYRVR
jgi:hypothetical protein